jgi:hypothetical protein
VVSYTTFSPLPALIQNAGGLIFCGTVRRDGSRRRRPRISQPDKLELRGIAPFGVRTFLFRLAPEAILHPSKTTGKIADWRKISRNEFRSGSHHPIASRLALKPAVL